MAKKVTLETLIARKQQGELDKLRVKEVYVKELNGSIIVKKVPIDKVLGLLDGINTVDSLKDNISMMVELIYHSCPIMQDKTLQEVYECVEPYDVVLAVLNDNIADLNQLAEEILEFYGLSDLEDKVKN